MASGILETELEPRDTWNTQKNPIMKDIYILSKACRSHDPNMAGGGMSDLLNFEQAGTGGLHCYVGRHRDADSGLAAYLAVFESTRDIDYCQTAGTGWDSGACINHAITRLKLTYLY